jgi:hypothetical protein
MLRSAEGGRGLNIQVNLTGPSTQKVKHDFIAHCSSPLKNGEHRCRI